MPLLDFEDESDEKIMINPNFVQVLEPDNSQKGKPLTMISFGEKTVTVKGALSEVSSRINAGMDG